MAMSPDIFVCHCGGKVMGVMLRVSSEKKPEGHESINMQDHFPGQERVWPYMPTVLGLEQPALDKTP